MGGESSHWVGLEMDAKEGLGPKAFRPEEGKENQQEFYSRLAERAGGPGNESGVREDRSNIGFHPLAPNCKVSKGLRVKEL